MVKPEIINAECLMVLKAFINEIEEGRIRITQMKHDIGIKPWSGKYAVGIKPEFSGAEWLTIYIERKQGEPELFSEGSDK